jgi:hypothetical protein
LPSVDATLRLLREAEIECSAQMFALEGKAQSSNLVVASFGYAKEEHAAIIEFFLQHPFSPGRGTVSLRP